MNDEVLRGFDETAQALFSSLRFISGATKPSYEELFALVSTTPLKQSAANGEKALRLDQLLGLTPTESESPIILHCEFERAESEQHRSVAIASQRTDLD